MVSITKISHKWYDVENDMMVVYIDLPKDVDEFLTVNNDGSYTAFIRSTACPDKQYAAYIHAIIHIKNNHLEDGVLVQDAERIAHAGI